MNKKIITIFAIAVLLLILLPFSGIVTINTSELNNNSYSSFIFWKLRVPRILLGFLAGSGLALGGLIFQNIFRNSLATPYTLGVSSGAAAGVMIALKLNLTAFLFFENALPFFGFVGAMMTVVLILLIASLVKDYSIYTLLMSGVAMNFFFAALIYIIQYISDYTQLVSGVRWMMGEIPPVPYSTLAWVASIYILFSAATFILRKELIIISAGDSFASSKGVNIKQIRILMFILVSLFTGIIISSTGPIGFIGLIIPHICRITFRGNFTVTMLGTMIGGGLFLVIADYLARILIPPAEIPVGIITALTGAPFFIFILISSLRRENRQ